ncbi:hypothetical protein F441_02512, partial [Phytophthora nicotianae CJ01A1]
LPSAYQDELIVLHTFQEKLSDDEVSLGVLFTSRRLFRNLLFARKGHRHHGIVVSVDGTYRLHHGGWTLVPFGTVGVIYDSRHGYSHRFFPIAYLFVRSETTKSYDELFKVIQNKCVDFLGWSLKVQFGTLDHADCVAAAFKMNWPNIVLLSFNVRNQVNCLQKSRCPGQFKALCTLVIENRIELGELDIAEWFKEEYLAADWKLWYYSASKAPGITPKQNPIEAHNRDIKRVVGPEINASTEVVLNSSLPRILSYFGSTRDSKGVPIIKPYSAGPVSIKAARTAMLLVGEGNYRKVERNSSVTGVLFNSRKYMIGDESVEATRVDESRAAIFRASLRGSLQRPEIVENMEPHYLSLHLVRVLTDLPFTHSWASPNWPETEVLRVCTKYHCDCKAFFVSGWLCSHILATLKLLDGFNLKVLLSSLPARKPPGRPRKVSKARQHDTPNTGQFAVPKLLEKLARRPGFPTNWKVLVPLDINDDDGITTKNFDGIVRPWFAKDGKYYWKIEFADADIDVEPYDIQELAHVLNHTARFGYAFV